MELPWIRLAVDFAGLDIFCTDLLQYVFQESFLKQFLSRGNTCYGLLKYFPYLHESQNLQTSYTVMSVYRCYLHSDPSYLFTVLFLWGLWKNVK
jgi:hypothetical protein